MSPFWGNNPQKSCDSWVAEYAPVYSSLIHAVPIILYFGNIWRPITFILIKPNIKPNCPYKGPEN